MTPALTRRALCRSLSGAALALAAPGFGGTRLPGAVLIEQASSAYATYARCFNARIAKRPAAVALCRNEEGVSSALDYARKQQLPVAIKSGGHSFEGFCLNDDGLVIDLSQMREHRLGDDGRTFSCGPGWKLGALYDLLLPRGKLLPAGSCGGVGVAGLTLGGGYGLFGRQFGLTCDRLTGIRVVTPDGIMRDSDQDPELLWACRGGGNGNFAVATEFRFALAPAPKTMTAHRFKARRLDSGRAVRLLKAWMDLEPKLPAAGFSAFVLNGRTLTILVTTTGDDEALRPFLEPLEKLADETRRGSAKPLLQAIRPFYGRPGPLPFKNASGGFYERYADLGGVAEALIKRSMATAGVIFQVNTLGGAMTTAPDPVGAAYAHRQARFIAELQAYWEQPAQAPDRIRAVAELQAILGANGHQRHYRNYPDLNIADAASAYYGNSLPRLQALKRKLDPDNRIRHPQSI